MTCEKSSLKSITFQLLILTTVLLSFFITAPAQQQSWSPVDNGRTAAFVLPSATGNDEINLYNGRVSLNIPLGTIGGRGSASYEPTITISRTFVIRRVNDWMMGSGQWSPPTLQLISERYQDSYDYSNFQPHLFPAVLFGRKLRDRNPGFGGSTGCSALTKLYLRLPGMEIELRDLRTGGEPDYQAAPLNRLRDWHSVDGNAVLFRSDSDIVDETCADTGWLAMNGGNVIYPTGYLMMKDGTRYRFVNGMPIWMRDRNGNTLVFGSTGTITDSLNRQYELDGSYSYPSGGFTYTGIDGTTRTVTVIDAPLAEALRADFVAGGVKLEQELFPSIASRLRGANQPFNPRVIKTIRLPNNLEYHFFYNQYGELARVEMPTGGIIEYDYDAPYGGLLGPSDVPQVYRVISAKRIYTSSGNLQTRQTFAFTGVEAPTVTTYDASDNVVANERHTFKGSVSNDFYFTGWYQDFDNGRELTVENLDATGQNVLRRSDNTWRTLDMAGTPTTLPSGVSTHQTNLDCALTATKVTLSDTNQVSLTTFAYNGFANQSDIYEYDVGASGSGVEGPLLRRSHTDFVTDPAYTSNTSPYLLGLPSQQWISSDSAGVNKVSLTTFEYDNYATDARHAPLVDRANITGLCLKLDDAATNCLQASDTSYVSRGNITQVTSYANISSNVVIRTATQFDIAGNDVKAIDGRGYPTTMVYADAFGTADLEARSNTAPSQLNGHPTFAFVTSSTNAMGHTSFMQYNYDTGLPVNQEDANGTVTSFEYGRGGLDLLDRPSKVIRAINDSSAKTQVSYVYNDTDRIITTFSDLANFDDKQIKNETVYDGLGRTAENRVYESATDFITTRMEYDALGREKRVFNPFRSTSDETYGWTETTYDLLSRVIKAQTFDGSGASTGTIQTAYAGPTTLVTDQAGKKRLSQSNPLGMLKVWEVTAPDSATTTVSFGGQSYNAYLTQYEYNVMGKLTKVTQGTQSARIFAYNNLGQITDATHPENGHTIFDYDDSGNLAHRTDARNVVTTNVYDPLNRLLTQSYSDGTPTVTYSYDTATLGVGQVAGVSSSVAGYSYTQYDALGRVTSSTQTVDGTPYTIGYQYNRAGALITQSYPSGRIVNTEYDAAGRVAGVKNAGTGNYYVGAAATDQANRLQYSSAGKLRAVKLGNNLWEHTNFNSRLQAVQLGLGTSTSDSSTLKLDFTYGVKVGEVLDGTQNNGNTESQTVTAPGLTLTQAYTYDELNRLKTAIETKTGAETWKQVFTYDAFGNRTFAAATTLPVINPQNENITNPSISPANNRISATGYDYDASGNLKCDPEHPCVSGTPYYEYNGENRLKAAGGGADAGGTSYFYDGNGRRSKKIVGGSPKISTVFIYNVQGQLIAEYSDAQQQNFAGTSYLTSDHLGTPRLTTNQAGAVKGRHDYLPFGQAIDISVGNRVSVAGYSDNDGLRQQFTGKERDAETGLDYFINRYYSSKQGRFISTDPLLASGIAVDPQTWNRYVYVNNNPLRYTDDDGLIKRDKHGNVIFVRDWELTQQRNGEMTHPGERNDPFRGVWGHVFADDGRQIVAFRSEDNDPRGETDCHGLTFADGRYFIANDQVESLLHGDHYEETTQPQVGDVAIYRERSGIVHSATVAEVDANGNVTLVVGLGGLQMSSHTTTPADQWRNPNATITYYHQRTDVRSPQDRQAQVVRTQNYVKASQRDRRRQGERIEREVGPPPPVPKLKKPPKPPTP
jgi:RHS repeat-associated protein